MSHFELYSLPGREKTREGGEEIGRTRSFRGLSLGTSLNESSTKTKDIIEIIYVR